MYAITEGVAKINGEIVDTFEREISDGRTALEVEAGTTGFVGEDCRNAGGRTYIGINCICGDFYFEPIVEEDGTVTGVEIACCGDEGLDAIMKALGFAEEVIADAVREINE